MVIRLNFLFNYNTNNRLKILLGLGSQLLKERLGKDAYQSSGDPTDGYLHGYEIHGGLRYFVTQKFFLTGWIGFFITKDNANSMLSKRPQYGITEDFGTITLNVNAIYEL